MKTNLDIIPITQWFEGIKDEPVIIAGPCSAENEQQVLDTAIEIRKIKQIKIFRAGIWKPRTRPNNFEGVGKIGLEWLKKVKSTTGLLTAVEVATPKHIEKCLKEGNCVDIIWIGARTTMNPFSVQEIASAIQGVDIPVLVKNPLNPDLQLWIGAIERMNKSGIKRVAAIHRGFYPFEQTMLRNIPKWEIAIELKSIFPNLSILCDPSHIAGNTEYIAEISQKAMDFRFNGLMIESHINPIQALSDAGQQITPFDLENLIVSLKIRNDICDNNDYTHQLEIFRNQIDSIDFQLIELLAKRMKIVEKIGFYKNQNNVSFFQLRRWMDIIKTRCDFGNKLGLSEEFIKEILQIVHKESVLRQSKL